MFFGSRVKVQGSRGTADNGLQTFEKISVTLCSQNFFSFNRMNCKRLHIMKSNTDYYPFGHCFFYETDNFQYQFRFNGGEKLNDNYFMLKL